MDLKWKMPATTPFLIQITASDQVYLGPSQRGPSSALPPVICTCSLAPVALISFTAAPVTKYVPVSNHGQNHRETCFRVCRFRFFLFFDILNFENYLTIYRPEPYLVPFSATCSLLPPRLVTGQESQALLLCNDVSIERYQLVEISEGGPIVRHSDPTEANMLSSNMVRVRMCPVARARLNGNMHRQGYLLPVNMPPWIVFSILSIFILASFNTSLQSPKVILCGLGLLAPLPTVVSRKATKSNSRR
jgi:hypothetical protein